jgi:hypothetical protein
MVGKEGGNQGSGSVFVSTVQNGCICDIPFVVGRRQSELITLNVSWKQQSTQQTNA